MLVTTIPEGYPQIRPPAELHDGGQVSYHFLICVHLGSFQHFTFFLLRSDKHTSHLVKKKKCEKYGHQITIKLQSVGVTLLNVFHVIQ